MNVNYYISPYPALTQNMVAKIYEVDINGATAEVGSQTILERNGSGVPTVGAGHQVPAAVTFNGLDKVTHEVRLYTAGGTLLHRYDVMPTTDLVTVYTPIRFKIGDGGANTPAAGTTAYSNTSMAGLTANDYIAIRGGYGPVHEGIHIANNVLGGFSLLLAGDAFSGDPAEEWTIIIQPKVVTTPVNDSVVGKLWGPTSGDPNMFLDVSSNTTYAPAHLRKLIRLSGSAEYTFGTVDIPPVGYIFRVTHFGAYTIGNPYPKVKFANASLLWNNTTKTELEIPPTSTVEFSFDGTSWNCTLNAIPYVATPQVGDILGTGRFVIGDISEGIYTVTHGLNLDPTKYKVYGVIYSRNSNHARDNTVCWAVREFAANSFKVTMQEIFGDVQAIDFDWMIVKTG